ncbi:hypothetical protein GT354_22315 [Streptomyces sp. SID3343]|nr:hypothetical protein [Streptomyces sp. SID3343]
MFDLIPAYGRLPQPSPTQNPYAPRLVAAGETFDVVEVDELLGRAVLAVLRTRNVPIGPVLHDRRHRKIGFLIPPTPVNDIPPRDRRTSPRHHGQGAWITFPPPGQPNGGPLTWLIEPTTHHLTDLRRLRTAITEAAHTLTSRARPGVE